VPATAGPINPALSIDINITGLTDHVVAYALWWRSPTAADWTFIGEGHTGDNLPDHWTLSAPSGSQVYYWIGIGNPRKPKSVYNTLLTVGQGGERLPGGSILVNGKTNAAGNDSIEDWVILL
jgi:hypothetical protein